MQACDRLIDNHATELSPHEIVREASQQRAQHIEIGIGPIRKDAIRQPFSRGIQQGDHLAAPFADGGFTHALVVQRGAPLNEAQVLEIRHLAADRRLVAAGAIRQFDNTDRPITAELSAGHSF